VEEGGTLDAGSTPSKPFPVPWFAGCRGNSVAATSVFLVSILLVSALATIALDVSGTSGRAGGMALVIGVAGCCEPAEASCICPALTCTVLTLTGFIGSDEPGIAAIGWVWITPLVSGAGWALACGGTAAVAAAKIDRAAERTGGAVAGSDNADAT
jgi:hypothetical protein